MEFNRNQYFMVGVVLVLLGVQFRMVGKYVLNEPATQFIATRLSKSSGDAPRPEGAYVQAGMPALSHEVKPPPWLGWACISIGAVLILHSLAMQKPD